MPLERPPGERIKPDAWTDYMAIRTILLPDYRVAFARLRKNASSSLQVAINESTNKHARDIRIPVRPKLKHVHGIAAMRGAVDDGYLVSAIIRHPVDRLVGAWHYFRGKNVARLMADTDLPLDDWIMQILEHDPLHLDEHVAPQSIQITDERGMIPQRLLRHEKVVEDWASLAEEVRQKPYELWLREFPHENKRANKAKTIRPNILVENEVRKRWDFDFKALGYDVT